MCNGSRLPCRNISKEMGNNSLRQVVSLYLIFHRQLLKLRCKPPMAPNNLFKHAFMAKVIQSFIFSITLSGCINKR